MERSGAHRTGARLRPALSAPAPEHLNAPHSGKLRGGKFVVEHYHQVYAGSDEVHDVLELCGSDSTA